MKKKSVKLLIACLLSCAGVASAAGAAGSVRSGKGASAWPRTRLFTTADVFR